MMNIRPSQVERHLESAQVALTKAWVKYHDAQSYLDTDTRERKSKAAWEVVIRQRNNVAIACRNYLLGLNYYSDLPVLDV